MRKARFIQRAVEVECPSCQFEVTLKEECYNNNSHECEKCGCKFTFDYREFGLTEDNELDLAGVLEIMLKSYRGRSSNEDIYYGGGEIYVSIKSVEKYIARLRKL